MTLKYTPSAEAEDDEDEELLGPEDDRVELNRLPTLTAGPCDGCAEEKSKMMLTLSYAKNYVTLCPICEGETLSKMLANYLRRKVRGKSNGFTGELLKEEAAEVAADEAEDMEIDTWN